MSRTCSKESIRKRIETRKKNALLRGYFHSEETKRKIGLSNSIVLKGRRRSQTSIEKMKATREMRGLNCHSEETKRKISIFQKQRKHKPTSLETKNKLRKVALGRITSKETRIKLSKIGIDYWNALPLDVAEARIAKALKASGKATGKRPNKFESVCIDKLNRIYPNKFKYTGDGTFLVNRHSADAYSEELNTVVLFNGAYWHLDHLGLENTIENKKLRELVESKPFLDAGYNVLFIWEDELDTIVRLAC